MASLFQQVRLGSLTAVFTEVGEEKENDKRKVGKHQDIRLLRLPRESSALERGTKWKRNKMLITAFNNTNFTVVNIFVLKCAL